MKDQAKRFGLLIGIAAMVLCGGVLIGFVYFERDWDQQHGHALLRRVTEGDYTECSEFPEELQGLLDQFPTYSGPTYCATSNLGGIRILDLWRLNGASKQMFEYASTENRLVGKLASEIDDIFWNIPLPWWSPSSNRSSSLFAASPGNVDASMEGIYTAIMFDPSTNVLYGLTMFNL